MNNTALKFILAITAIFLVLVGCSSSSSNKIIGKWKISGITPEDTSLVASMDLAVIMWLNILSEKATIEFTNDSCFISTDSIISKHSYKIVGNKLILTPPTDNEDYFVEFVNDTTVNVKNKSTKLVLKR